jgi:hypothetical protein
LGFAITEGSMDASLSDIYLIDFVKLIDGIGKFSGIEMRTEKFQLCN